MTAKDAQAKKPRGKPFVKGADPRRKIAPNTDAVQLTRILRRVITMTGAEAANMAASLAPQLRKFGDSVTLGELIVLSAVASTINDPQPGLLREIWRRIDGEVTQTFLDVDPAALTDEQLERIRDGESIESVVTNPRGAGIGISSSSAGKATAAALEPDSAA